MNVKYAEWKMPKKRMGAASLLLQRVLEQLKLIYSGNSPKPAWMRREVRGWLKWTGRKLLNQPLVIRKTQIRASMNHPVKAVLKDRHTESDGNLKINPYICGKLIVHKITAKMSQWWRAFPTGSQQPRHPRAEASVWPLPPSRLKGAQSPEPRNSSYKTLERKHWCSYLWLW